MDAVFDWFADPLQYEFMRRALIEVVLMGAVTGAIGTYVVLRGLSFIGDALSHAIFPGIVIAYLLGSQHLPRRHGVRSADFRRHHGGGDQSADQGRLRDRRAVRRDLRAGHCA